MSDEQKISSWENLNLYKVKDLKEPVAVEKTDDKAIKQFRPEIEPWLTALVQSEHLSLLVGSGLSTSLLPRSCAKSSMGEMDLTEFKEQIESASKESAEKAKRGKANIEDQIRVCNELIRGLEIYVLKNFRGVIKVKKQLKNINEEFELGLKNFINQILKDEHNIIYGRDSSSKNLEDYQGKAGYLMNFLISFASRSATRERLNIFTTNYDRVIEFGSELAGIRLIDRFVGSVNPIFRSSRMEVDMHYNPPGIRGEPRYLEGVAHFTKLHGSLDWSVKDRIVRRYALPYGAQCIDKYLDNGYENFLIYPNAAKDRETAGYPYVELFRDFAVSIGRPNSTVFVYGYGFGDEHINRVLKDMLTIPSTHLVIMSFDHAEGRIKYFYDCVNRPAQISLLIGNHFGCLENLVDYYLPKPAIDRTTIRMAELLKARGLDVQSKPECDQNTAQNPQSNLDSLSDAPGEESE